MSTAASPTAHAHDFRHGIVAGLAAYFIWGLVPVFFKQLKDVSAIETIAHRVVWSMVLMGIVLLCSPGRFTQVIEFARDPRKLARVAAGSVMVLTNWLVFIYGINVGEILATSLGYFILPILNIALGVMVLKERLRPVQWLAVLCAIIGVLIETLRLGTLPWISLALAASFGFYGLMRKQLAMDSASGLFLETACIVPVALGYLLWLDRTGTAHWGESVQLSALLIASGAVTAIPLLLFAISARRLPLNLIAFLQYLAPSISFLVAVLIYHEPFDLHRAAGFGAIWLGIAVYSLDLWRHAKTS